MKLAVKLVVGLLAAVVLYLGVTFAQVWGAARDDQARPAEAIVVFGTAQYNGVPSPVLAARLDHDPVARDERLRVHHPRRRAAEGTIGPGHGLRTDDLEFIDRPARPPGSIGEHGIDDRPQRL